MYIYIYTGTTSEAVDFFVLDKFPRFMAQVWARKKKIHRCAVRDGFRVSSVDSAKSLVVLNIFNWNWWFGTWLYFPQYFLCGSAHGHQVQHVRHGTRGWRKITPAQTRSCQKQPAHQMQHMGIRVFFFHLTKWLIIWNIWSRVNFRMFLERMTMTHWLQRKRNQSIPAPGLDAALGFATGALNIFPICEPWCWNMHTNIYPNKITQFCR